MDLIYVCLTSPQTKYHARQIEPYACKVIYLSYSLFGSIYNIQPQLLVAVVRFDFNASPFDPCMRFFGFFHKLAGTLKFNGGKYNE